MRTRDRALTCFRCRAYDIVSTDPLTSRLMVVESRACTCPVKVKKPQSDDLSAICVDCGDPCRYNALRCIGCKGARDQYTRLRAKRRAMHRCEDCPEMILSSSRRCPDCRKARKHAIRKARKAA